MDIRKYLLIILTKSIVLKTIFIYTIFLPGCVNNDHIISPGVSDVRISKENSLAYRIDIVLDDPAPISVKYGKEGGRFLEVKSENVSTTHSILLARLIADSQYSVIVNSGGQIFEDHFITDPLPEDLSAINFETSGIPTYPLTLMKLFYPEGFWGYGIINSEGDIVWYYRTVERASGATRRTNGNFVFIDFGVGLVEVNPAGNIVATLSHESLGGEIHHDVINTPDDALWFIVRYVQSVDGEDIVGEAIWEWIPETGETTKLWSSFDHLDPTSDWGTRSNPENWLHVNALSLGPRNNLLISSHFLNQIISIAPDFKSFEWRFGGVNATIEVDEAERFSGQHTPSENNPGRILLFDNGFERGGFSRAVEFQLDGDRAQKVWEFRPVQDNWARIISSARRLDNNNTFVCFGVSDQASDGAGRIEVYEVTPEGNIIWHMQASGALQAMYRATPLETIAGERYVND